MLDEFIEEENTKQEQTADNNILKSLESFVDMKIEQELNYSEDDTPYIENRNQAEYFISMYKKSLETIEQNKLAHDQYLDDLKQKADQWLDNANKEHKYIVEQVGLLLEDYARKNIKPEDNKKSIKLINGTIGIRAQQPEFIYGDENIIVEFLQKNDDSLLIHQPDKIDKKKLKKSGTIDGEKFKLNGVEVPSLTIQNREDTFYVK